VKALVGLYDRLLAGLALLAAAAFGAVAFIIVYEVSARWLGFRPPVWPQAISEYTMLYATLFGAPWVLHRAEHVQVTTLVAMLPRSSRAALARAMSALGMLVCVVVAWFALQVTLNAQGLEIRSFEMPKWVLYAPLPLGFLLLAIEFFRHTLAGSLFAGEEIEYYDRRREA
jgi:TRAP-type C4-dicarboxylate transport system permease small subunit